MAIIIYDRVQETTTTVGTGNLTLLGASAGYRTFDSTVGVSNQTYYGIIDNTSWEIGIGTLISSTVLRRDSVLNSTSSGNKITLSGNTSLVFIDVPASRRLQTDAASIGLSGETDFSGDTVEVNTIKSTNINTNNNSSNTIGQAGQTTFYGDGSNLTGLYRQIDGQSGTTYTLSLGDQMVTLNNSSAITVTVPLNVFSVLTEIDLIQLGTGQVTISAEDGVTLNSYVNKVSLAGQYAGATLKQLSTNNWILIGNLA